MMQHSLKIHRPAHAAINIHRQLRMHAHTGLFGFSGMTRKGCTVARESGSPVPTPPGVVSCIL